MLDLVLSGGEPEMEVMRHDPQVLGVLLRPELDYKAVQVPIPPLRPP